MKYVEGKLLWQQCLGGSNYELGYGLIETSDGGFATVGGSASRDGQVLGSHGGWIPGSPNSIEMES